MSNDSANDKAVSPVLMNPRGSAPHRWPAFKGELPYLPSALGGDGMPPSQQHPRLRQTHFALDNSATSASSGAKGKHRRAMRLSSQGRGAARSSQSPVSAASKSQTDMSSSAASISVAATSPAAGVSLLSSARAADPAASMLLAGAPPPAPPPAGGKKRLTTDANSQLVALLRRGSEPCSALESLPVAVLFRVMGMLQAVDLARLGSCSRSLYSSVHAFAELQPIVLARQMVAVSSASSGSGVLARNASSFQRVAISPSGPGESGSLLTLVQTQDDHIRVLTQALAKAESLLVAGLQERSTLVVRLASWANGAREALAASEHRASTNEARIDELSAQAQVQAQAREALVLENESLQTQLARVERQRRAADELAAELKKRKERAEARVAYLETLGFDARAHGARVVLSRMHASIVELRKQRTELSSAVAALAAEHAMQLVRLSEAHEGGHSARLRGADFVPLPSDSNRLDDEVPMTAEGNLSSGALALRQPAVSADGHVTLLEIVRAMVRRRAQSKFLLFCANFMGRKGIADPLRHGAAVRIQTWWRGCVIAGALRHAGTGADGSQAKAPVSKLVIPRHIAYWHDPHSDDIIAFTINAIDLQLLIRKVTQPRSETFALVHTLLLTYPVFLSANDLLTLFVMRFYSLPENTGDLPIFLAGVQCPLQAKVLEVIRIWLAECPEDFFEYADSPALRSQLERFINLTKHTATTHALVVSELAALEADYASLSHLAQLAAMQSPRPVSSTGGSGGEGFVTVTLTAGTPAASAGGALFAEGASSSSSGNRPVSMNGLGSLRLSAATASQQSMGAGGRRVSSAAYGAMSLSGGTSSIPRSRLITSDKLNSIVQMHPLEVARQLALMGFDVFRRIRRRELLRQAWVKGSVAQARAAAPNILSLIDFFNITSNWAAAEVLKGARPEERAHIICILLDTANNCLVLNDFSSLMAIVSSLQGVAVARLKHTWSLLPPEYEEHWRALTAFMSFDHNYHKYRDALKGTQPPVVPYMGLYLQDLTFIDDGNRSLVGEHESLVNFAKHRMTSAVIDEILRMSSVAYRLHPVAPIQAYIAASVTSVTEDVLYNRSLELEPRDLKPPEKKRKPIVYAPLEGNEFPDFDASADTEGFVTELLTSGEPMTVKGGHFIVREGEKGTNVYYVVTGIVQVELPDGRVIPLNQGDFFGEMAVFLDSSGRRCASVRAVSETVQVLVCASKALGVLLCRHPGMKAQFTKLARDRLEANVRAGASERKPAKWMERIAGQEAPWMPSSRGGRETD